MAGNQNIHQILGEWEVLKHRIDADMAAEVQHEWPDTDELEDLVMLAKKTHTELARAQKNAPIDAEILREVAIEIDGHYFPLVYHYVDGEFHEGPTYESELKRSQVHRKESRKRLKSVVGSSVKPALEAWWEKRSFMSPKFLTGDDVAYVSGVVADANERGKEAEAAEQFADALALYALANEAEHFKTTAANTGSVLSGWYRFEDGDLQTMLDDISEEGSDFSSGPDVVRDLMEWKKVLNKELKRERRLRDNSSYVYAIADELIELDEYEKRIRAFLDQLKNEGYPELRWKV